MSWEKILKENKDILADLEEITAAVEKVRELLWEMRQAPVPRWQIKSWESLDNVIAMIQSLEWKLKGD
mgnify:CR=1 FL=1|tara:strand:- start:195 stop:398 length:204 start_codon:yes stop_codon:yes gene_type:complete